MKKTNPSRRQFLRIAGLGAVGLSLEWQPRTLGSAPKSRELLVYIGTYTTNSTAHSEGIYICRLDLSSGELRRITGASAISSSGSALVTCRKCCACSSIAAAREANSGFAEARSDCSTVIA